MTVTVYTKPGCGPCRMTCRRLDAEGIPYTTVDITQNDAARDYVMALGYQQAPVVVAGTEYWSGFRPERIAALSMEGAAA
ncbi:glutaredoxin family protein [Gordonia alkaliphila]|uniref:Glutaredoxin-like protein NrdH n=1 Tax=Gordonia alkaliphila TaxID=1053547 RepID=A0ABP8ZIY3_9ACTN